LLRPYRRVRRTLLDRVIARFHPQVARLLLNANGDAGRFARFDLPVTADTIPGFLGPLAGILAGLEWASASHPDRFTDKHLRTVQRAVKMWRGQQARRIIIDGCLVIGAANPTDDLTILENAVPPPSERSPTWAHRDPRAPLRLPRKGAVLRAGPSCGLHGPTAPSSRHEALGNILV
jgi:hypothetical protein